MRVTAVQYPEEQPIREGAFAQYVFSGEEARSETLGERGERLLSALLNDPSFRGKKGKVLRVPLEDQGFSWLYVVGLGERGGCTDGDIRARTAELLRRLRADGVSRLTVALPLTPDGALSCAVAEGAVLGNYTFETYKTGREDHLPQPEEVVLLKGIDGELSRGRMLAEAQNRSRDLANEPGNKLTPELFADVARRWGEDAGLSVTVWDEGKILAERMEGLSSVGRGSVNPPRLVHLVWNGAGAAKKIVLVGKGITFDSGGLDLKPADFLRTMKGDKTGACNVLAVLLAAAEMKIPCEVHGIAVLAENMPGGGAYRPDDILRMRNGKTVEIDNTDAEGRLVLADALSYASELKPDAVIDMATLTGACAVALGTNMAGLFSSDDALAADFLGAAARRGERFWRMPLEDERIAESLKSPVADLVNAGSRYGGAIFAAQFLREFVAEGIPWMHLDIAGVDFSKDEHGIQGKGASGYAVRSCLDYLLSLCR